MSDKCSRKKADLTAPKSNFRFTPESGLKSDIAPCPSCAKPGHRDRFTRSPRRYEQAAYWHRFGKKGDYLPDKPMRCNRVTETTPNVKRYLTVRFDGWNSDERRALHSATSLARQNASPLARSPGYSVAWIGGCCDGRCCVGRGGTDLFARVTGASALM